ncbi:MAG TPA: tetratricopeptide repeat protein [Polyangia bacterium]|nr:tetratricopeptide repeat protein [Polyangia bacterium]
MTQHRILPAVVLFLSVVGIGALVFAPAPVWARDPPAVAKLIQINRRALDDYDKKDWRSAKSHLWDAIAEGKRAGLENHPIMARTYLHLGAVYLVGLDDREVAVQFFARALRIDPTIRVSAAMETTEIAGAFLEAQTTTARLHDTGVGATANNNEAPPAAAPPPRPANAAPPPPPEKTADEEEAPPVSGSGLALDCPNADEVVRDQVATVRCSVAAGLKVSTVMLFYRLPGEGSFTGIEMKKTGQKNGWYIGQIAKEVTGGKSLQFYVEGRDQNGKAIVANGGRGSPNLMLVRDPTAAAAPAVELPPTASSAVATEPEENPLDVAPGAVVHRAASKNGSPLARKWWIGLGIGSGFGYAHGDGLESRKDLQPLFGSGAGWAGLGQASPEVGLHISPTMAVALQGRNQWIPHSGSDAKGAATSANAALLRLLFFSQPRALRFYGGPVAGYGTFRFLFSAPEPTGGGTARDTIKGGLFVAGGGAGLSYALTQTLSFMVETNALFGYSAFSVVCDLNAGLQINFY